MRIEAKNSEPLTGPESLCPLTVHLALKNIKFNSIILHESM